MRLLCAFCLNAASTSAVSTPNASSCVKTISFSTPPVSPLALGVAFELPPAITLTVDDEDEFGSVSEGTELARGVVGALLVVLPARPETHACCRIRSSGSRFSGSVSKMRRMRSCAAGDRNGGIL